MANYGCYFKGYQSFFQPEPNPGRVPNHTKVIPANHAAPSTKTETHKYAASREESRDPNAGKIQITTHDPGIEGVKPYNNAGIIYPQNQGLDMENIVNGLEKYLDERGTRTALLHSRDGDDITVHSLSLDNKGKDRFLIACEFYGKPGDVTGHCYMDDAKGRVMDGFADYIYQGPERRGKHSRMTCLQKRGPKGNMATCMPFRRITKGEKAQVSEYYQNLIRKILGNR
ncbi:hypothetical protein KY349_04715 [Candidatus Woesearchaeota archaeon]|nr:hypothetical protein [Candidatus Woesearchaeota archaeon]